MQTKYHSLYGQMLEPDNLRAAWKKVKAKQGKGGVDGQSIADFEADLASNMLTLWEECKTKMYRPQPVRRVYIPKAGKKDEYRPLGIPAIRDRVVQQMALQVLEPVFEPQFLDCSFGFRPGRSAHMALDRVSQHLSEGYGWAVDVDLKGYFDTIPHDRLIDRVAEKVADGSILRLIRAFLEAGVMEEGTLHRSVAGTPQGGVISPLLANLYLHPFDVRMTERGHKLTRYADDFVILCRSERAAKRVMADVKEYLEQELALVVHPEKSRIVHVREGFVFLGYLFKGRNRRPSDKALDRFKHEVRRRTRRNQTVAMKYLLAGINPYLRGWGRYFGYGTVKQRFAEFDKWVRRRLRAVQLRSWRKVRHLHSILLRKGWKREELGGLRMDRWRSSASPLVHAALDNDWFKNHGLVSLLGLHKPVPRY
jgi:RNA-directed DNA polymerase